MADPIAALLKIKRRAHKTMCTERDAAKSQRARAKWVAWIKKNDKEIAALESAQEQIAGMRKMLPVLRDLASR